MTEKMINFEDVRTEKIKEHNPNWPHIPDLPYKILTTGGSGSGKKNWIFNLINPQPDIDKIYLYAKDPNIIQIWMIFIKIIEEYNLNKKRKTLIV